MEKQKLIEIRKMLINFEEKRCSEERCCENCSCNLENEPIYCALDKIKWEIEKCIDRFNLK